MSESESTETPLLTHGQRRVVGFALSLLAFVGCIALLVYCLGKLAELIGFFSSVLWPLAVAGIMAMIMRPIVELLESRLKLHRTSAVMVLYGVFVLLVGGALFFITPPLVEQLLDFIAFIPTFWSRALLYVEGHYPEWITVARTQMQNETVKKIVGNVAETIRQMASNALPGIGVGAISIFSFITHLAVVPIYLFFFLLSSREPTKNLGQHLPFLKPDLREDVVFLVGEFISIVVSFFRGQLLIGLIMGALLAIGFTVVGLKFGLFIGLGLGILNIVPYLGTILGLSIAIPLAFFQPDGGATLVGLVLGVFAFVQMTEGWFLTPRIMGKRTGLHPVAIMFSIFFWGTALNGILGMVLAIPLTAFFVTAWRLAKKKYFHQEPTP